MPTVNPELLHILVCPLSKADLVEHGDALVSTDSATRRSYAIVDGIPDLLIEHSRQLEVSEWQRTMQAAGRQTFRDS